MRGLDLPGGALLVTGLTGLTLGISRGGLSGWDDALTIGGLVAGAVLLPVFLLVEHRGRAPMLDLEIFRDRLFSAAAAAAFLNGLARFALMFVFVFYYQGAQGDGPVLAGVKLAPLAIGMLVASPLAGVWADRHGSRLMATAGMALHGARPGADDDAAGRHGLLGGRRVPDDRGHRLRHVQLAQHGGDDGRRARHRRGVAAATRVLAQNTGAVMSIALVMALITSSIEEVLFKIFSGLTSGLAPETLAPFIANMHTALWVLTATAVIGVLVCALRPRTVRRAGEGPGVRIGDLAERVGTTTRTIRYYEEIGLLWRRRARAPAPTAPTTRPTSSAWS